MEYTDKVEALELKYENRMEKKMQGKPEVVKVIMSRTFSSACMILAALDNIPFAKLTFNIYYLCEDIKFMEIVKLYDAQLELAGANPEKFVFSLHSFYNNISNKLKKEKKYKEFGEFTGAITRLHSEKKDTLDKNILDAYLSLVLQTLEYIRKDKFDIDTYAYGVSTDGELLMGPCPLPYSDFPVIEYKKAKRQGRKFKSNLEEVNFIMGLYRKHGFDIKSKLDLDILQQTQRIHNNTTTAMFPFINEFTFDIAPINYYNSNQAPLMELICLLSNTDTLQAKLQHRNRTLPSNGVKFEITDPSGELKSALLKEILHDTSIHLLYRLDTANGSLSGYYDTATQFFYSATKEATSPEPYQNIQTLILTLYASQVLNDISLEKVEKLFIQPTGKLQIKAYGKSGRLQDTYHKAPDDQSHRGSRDPEHYNKEERHINVIIRTLPAGRQASEEAKALAAQYGYELEPNQTFVRPFIKQVFVKKDKQGE